MPSRNMFARSAMRARIASLVGALSLAALAIPLLPAASARAQSDATEAAAARELYGQGVEAARAGRLEEAIARFERSYALSPRDATLLNLAQVSEQARHVVAAIDAYRRFLARAEPDMLERHGERAREAIERLTPEVGRLEVVVFGAQAGDEILLDGTSLSRESLGLDLPVDPGAHEVVVRRGAASCGSQTRTITPGGRGSVELRVFCAAVVTDAGTSDVAAPGSEDPAPYIALGIAGGVLVVGAIIVGVVLAMPSDGPDPFVGNVGMGSWVIP